MIQILNERITALDSIIACFRVLSEQVLSESLEAYTATLVKLTSQVGDPATALTSQLRSVASGHKASV